jgi:cytochrome c oxidase subunit 2
MLRQRFEGLFLAPRASLMTRSGPRRHQGDQQIMTRSWNRTALLVLALGLSSVGAAHAGLGQPTPWQMGMQEPDTEVAADIGSLHTALVWIITIISLFVLGLLITVVVRFNEKANPVPSRTTHHTGLEIAWTLIPVLILVGIAIPSFRLLKFQVELPKADLTIKAIGNQWFWSYEYPKDQGGGFRFDSYMLSREDAAKEGQPGLLAVDNEVVVPVGKTVVLQVVGADVIHSFSVPSLGFRMDAIPGRLNQTWFKADREGLYYGQCSRLCGQNHAFMPIAIRVVSDKQYADWLTQAKQKFASTDSDSVKLAAQ